MHLSRWLVAAVLFLALAAFGVARFFPPLPNPLTLEFELDAASRESEPILTSGITEQGDFLYLRQVEPGKIIIGYDSWNSDQSDSPPVPAAAGQRHRLRIEMPSLDQFQGHFSGAQPGRVRVSVDGNVALDAVMHYYVRKSSALYLGENPIGGTSAQRRFKGKLFDATGREVRGDLRAVFSWPQRIAGWLRYRAGEAIGLLVICWLLVGVGSLLRPAKLRLHAAMLRAVVRPHRWFCAATAVGGLIFAWFVTMGGFDFTYSESFCDFYDHQARSLLEGRLNVPEECLSGEAFKVDGKTYGYFGLTPALLRLPFAVFDFGLGRLSRGFMLVDYLGALVAAYLLLLTVRRGLFGVVAPPRAAATFLFIGNVGLGSTLLFLGSRSYIYHEAILCGVTFALFATWCALRYWRAPASRWWIGAWICGVLSVNARPPAGLFALGFLALVALAHAIARRSSPAARSPRLVVALCLVGVLSFNGTAYLKFKTFDGQPLRYNVSYSPERLAKFGEKKFHAANIPYVAQAYLVAPSFHLSRWFPWFYAETKPMWRPVWTRMDMIEPTVGFPFAMTGLVLLVVVGGGLAWFTQPATRVPIVLLKLAVLPTALFMFAAIAVSHRYTADFVPALIAFAAIGFAAIEQGLARGARGLLGLLWLATAWAVFVTVVLTLHTQREQLWGVPERVRASYEQMRGRIDGLFGVKR